MVDFSIIIPHKDIPDLLQRCLDSIPVRDDVQVIVVDDNSDGNIVDFDHFPQWKGEHYECYFTKEGKGAGYARNVGISHVKGKWLLFMDADDILLPTVNIVFEEEIDSTADIIFFRPKFVHSYDLNIASNRRMNIYNSYIDSYLEKGDEIELRTRWHTPWSKLFRFSLISGNGIRFEETKYSNDVMFSTISGCKAALIEARDKCFYVVTEREGSLTSRFCQKEGELETRASVFFKSQQIVREYKFPLDEELAARFLRRLFNGNRHLFKYYFILFCQLSGDTRIQLLNHIFEANRPLSRIKREAFAFLITMF